MNDKNYEYLKDNLKYMGFGEGLAEALKEQMQTGAPTFHLSLDTEINRKTFSAVLSFRKSANTDMYFFQQFPCDTYPVQWGSEGSDVLPQQE